MGTFISCSRVGVPLGPFPSPPQLRVGEQSKQMQPHPSTLLNSGLSSGQVGHSSWPFSMSAVARPTWIVMRTAELGIIFKSSP